MTALGAVLVLALGADSWCANIIQRDWAGTGLDAPCLVLDGTPETMRAAARQRWGLTEEQATCALAAKNHLSCGSAEQWRACVERWPEVTLFWGALLDAESDPEKIPFDRLTPQAAGKLYALKTRHARRVADLVLAAKPEQLAGVLSTMLHAESAFEVAWVELERRKTLTSAEWEAVGRALVPLALDEEWLEFAAETWLRLPAKTRAVLAAAPLRSTRSTSISRHVDVQVDLRSTLAFALASRGDRADAARITFVPTEVPDGGYPGALRRTQTFDRLVAAQRSGALDDPWEVAVTFSATDLPEEALSMAFVPRARGKGRAIGPYTDLVAAKVTSALLSGRVRLPPEAASAAVQAAHDRWVARLAALAGVGDGGLALDEGVRRDFERQRAVRAAYEQGGADAVKALLQQHAREDEVPPASVMLPEAPWPYVERADGGVWDARREARAPSASLDGGDTRASSPTPRPAVDGSGVAVATELPRGFSAVRSERAGDATVTLATSQRFDPTGEVSRGGYWLLISKDGGGRREVYLGFSVHRPFKAHASSNVPLLRDGVVRLDVAEAPLDERSITFPPVSLKAKSVREHVVLEARLDDVARDSDGDGLSDLAEARLLLDPAKRDTDGDGILDGDDLLPRADDRLPAGPMTELYGTLLEHFGVKRGLTPLVVEPGQPATGTPLTRDLERTTFLVSEPGKLAGVHTLSRVVTLTEDELAAARRKYGGFYPVVLTVRMSEDGKHALVNWSDNPSWGILRADLGADGKWRLESLRRWIS